MLAFPVQQTTKCATFIPENRKDLFGKRIKEKRIPDSQRSNPGTDISGGGEDCPGRKPLGGALAGSVKNK